MTPNLYDLNSANGVRQIVAALFQGYNYRVYTEGQTRNQLLDAYQRLIAVRRRSPCRCQSYCMDGCCPCRIGPKRK